MFAFSVNIDVMGLKPFTYCLFSICFIFLFFGWQGSIPDLFQSIRYFLVFHFDSFVDFLAVSRIFNLALVIKIGILLLQSFFAC